MESASLDLHLLRVFETMLALRSVTHAASTLKMSQPSISYSLNKLREYVDDPLFVRIGNEMQPTPRALELAGPIRRILDTLEHEVATSSRFVPETTRREFTFCMTDIGEMHYIPPLLKAVELAAPRVTFRVKPLAPDRLDAALENGDVDLAVGYFPDLSKDRFFQQLLSVSSFVCVARKGNPAIGRKLTTERYCSASHVMVNTQVRTLEVLDRKLREAGYASRLEVKLQVAHFLTLLDIVSTSDLVATVPLEVAAKLTATGRVVAHTLPFESPTFSLRQHWHQRYHHEPGNQWLRGMIRSVFSDQGGFRC